MGIIRRPNTVNRVFTWWPKRMSSGNLVIGYYYEMIIFKYGADPRHALWIQKKILPKGVFLIKTTRC